MQKILNPLNLSSENAGGSTGGQWWSAINDGPCIQSINPANEQLIASVNPVSQQDYLIIKEAALKAYAHWQQVPAPVRGQLVQQLGEALRQKKDALGSLVSLEMGKSKQEGDGEVQEMIDMADFAVGQSRMLYGLSMHSERAQHRMYEQWHPRGIVGIISAFNFPVAVWAWNAFLAAICGNVCIWKPSSKTPLCAIAIQQICNTVMQQNGYEAIFNLLITADNQLAEQFVKDEDIALLSFTGSSAVGLQVKKNTAKQMKESLLELSGNNAIIVDETADLDMAIKAAFFSAIGTAGQRCTSARRLFLQASIYDQFMASLQSAYQQVTIGDPLDINNLMGPLIDQQAVDNFSDTISKASKSGGKVLHGGKLLEQPGFFVEPTLIAAKNEWDVVQAETFAPILYVMKFDRLSEAITQQNAVKQGLSSALFSQHLQHIELFLSSLGSDCGIANINQGTSGAEIGGAFGGEKWTGGGREAGSDSWKTYMRRQTVTVNWGKEMPLAQGIKFTND